MVEFQKKNHFSELTKNLYYQFVAITSKLKEHLVWMASVYYLDFN